jgi:hypothetical protein
MMLLDQRSQFACQFLRTNKKFVQPCVNVRKGIINELYWQHSMKYNLEVLLMEYAPSRGGSTYKRETLYSVCKRILDFENKIGEICSSYNFRKGEGMHG